MTYIAATPFGRRTDALCLIEQAISATTPPPLPHMDKWQLFRQLCTARHAFDVTDRDLTVLNALLSFYPDHDLSADSDLVVFPSNRTLSDRTHGMAESTLRRHLAALVKAGLIQRRDSPNGKRYALRRRNGDTARAYGFDLSPLLYRAVEISQAACAAEEIAERMRDLRHDISLMKRDALMLLEQMTADNRDNEWESLQSNLLEVHKLTRRKLSLEQLEILHSNVENLLNSLRDASCETVKMDGSDSENERHYHNANKDTFESEPHDIDHQASVPTVRDTSTKKDPDIKIATVLAACPDIKPYHPDQIRNWADLLQAAQLVHSMMGISNELWEQAKSVMGPIQASVALAAILQRISKINNPGGYLRCLNRKADAKQFSVTPMVMALLRNQS